MQAGVLARGELAEHGEMRAYHLADRGELVLEVLREADGRAWQLRLPVREQAAVARLVRQVRPALAAPRTFAFDEHGAALLGQTPIGPNDQVAAIVLAQDEERAFALWRRERLRDGWSWTIDVTLVPLALAPEFCAFAQEALTTLGDYRRNLPDG
jgi:hypothetical protein